MGRTEIEETRVRSHSEWLLLQAVMTQKHGRCLVAVLRYGGKQGHIQALLDLARGSERGIQVLGKEAGSQSHQRRYNQSQNQLDPGRQTVRDQWHCRRFRNRRIDNPPLVQCIGYARFFALAMVEKIALLVRFGSS